MMKAEQFAYWLQGFAELTPGQTPSTEQWEMIVEHLAEVFDKVTPPMKMGAKNAGDADFGLWSGGSSIGVLNTGGATSGAVLPRNSTLLSNAVAQVSDTAMATAISGLTTRVSLADGKGDSIANSLTC